MITVSSCSSSMPGGIIDLLNTLQDTLAKKTYSNEDLAKKHAREFASSISSNENNISNNIINASIFSRYIWNQVPGEQFLTQLQPISARNEGTKVLLTVRIAYYYNDNLDIQYFSDSKELMIQFYIPQK
jgi:hypothetical protein